MTLPVTTVADLLFGDRVARLAAPWADRFWPDRELASFMFPNEAVSVELQELHDDWGCEIFADRVWLAALAEMGVELPPEAAFPYAPHSGAIAAWLPNLGDRLGCRETREHHKPLDPPGLGDVSLLLHASSPHASVATGDADAEIGETPSIDGGQINGKNAKGVQARRRIYRIEDGVLVARDVDGVHSLASPGPASPVLWVMRAALVQV